MWNLSISIILGEESVEVCREGHSEFFLDCSLDSVDDLSLKETLEHVDETIPEAAMNGDTDVALVKVAEVVSTGLDAWNSASVLEGLQDKSVSENKFRGVNAHGEIAVGTEDAIVTMEVSGGELGRELVQLDGEAVVCRVSSEGDVVGWLGDREVVLLYIILVVVGVDDVWKLDAIDPGLDSMPVGFFSLLEHGDVGGEGEAVGRGVGSSEGATEHASKYEGFQHFYYYSQY